MPTSTRAQRELTETRLVQGQDDVEGANLIGFELTEVLLQFAHFKNNRFTT